MTARAEQARLAGAEAEALEWNTLHPIGTHVLVRSRPGEFFEAKTRSEAWVIPSGTAQVCVEGKSGGFWLHAVTALTEGESKKRAKARIDLRMDRGR
jgi:hypothetical protein